ncbi:MAG: RNA 2',3'-cyclic phosphodiesterase [Pseudomonadota bacterium]
MQEGIRSFIAFELPEEIRRSIAALSDRLRSFHLKARWIRPESIHLTLKFLGRIDPAQLEPVVHVMQDAVKGVAPFDLSAKGIGVFPGVNRPRVIWVGLSGRKEALIQIQGVLQDRLASIGYQKESRPFQGHLTLGRFKEQINPMELSKALEALGSFESPPFVLDTITLFQSELKPSGVVYTTLSSVRLSP